MVVIVVINSTPFLHSLLTQGKFKVLGRRDRGGPLGLWTQHFLGMRNSWRLGACLYGAIWDLEFGFRASGLRSLKFGLSHLR